MLLKLKRGNEYCIVTKLGKNLEKSSNHRKSCVDDDPRLGNDEKEVIKLKLATDIVPEFLDLKHSNEDSDCSEAVEE